MNKPQAVKNVGMHFDSLRLRNFTCFEDASLDFVGGVNALVGANGTGKTHILKALFAWQHFQAMNDRWLEEDNEANLHRETETFLQVFQADRESELVRFGGESNQALLEGSHGSKPWNCDFYRGSPMGARGQVTRGPRPHRPIFIPSVDMMGHTRRFTETYNEFRLDFDLTWKDIVQVLKIERTAPAPQFHKIIGVLAEILKGTIEQDETGRFFLVQSGNRQAMPMVAEGLRKVATLLTLVRNGRLKMGSCLFWDEPEVNLNPSFMDEIVGSILELTRAGVQVFLATHSYVILKELDLQTMRTDSIRYFALDNSEGATTINATDDFALLGPNAILDQYSSLYDRELTRSTGRRRRD